VKLFRVSDDFFTRYAAMVYMTVADGLNAHTTGVQQEMCVKIGPRVGGCELRFFAIPET